jgi:hypothetical protein
MKSVFFGPNKSVLNIKSLNMNATVPNMRIDTTDLIRCHLSSSR